MASTQNAQKRVRRSACEEAESLRGEVGAEARQKHKIGGEMRNERAVRGAAVQIELQRAFCSGEVEVERQS